MKNFWQELKRRKVIRVGIVYLIGAWAAVEAASVLFPALLLPEWTTRLVVALALIGFPVTVVLAWAFDVTERGVQKTAAKTDHPPRLYQTHLNLHLSPKIASMAGSGLQTFSTAMSGL
jgi:hypothetical protein